MIRVAMVGLRAPGAEGGVETVVAELAPRLVARGCAVSVVCRPRYNVHGASVDGVELVDVPTIYTKHLEAIVHTALAMPTLLGRGFDLIHIHAIGNAVLSFLPRAAGIPTVVTVHGLDWRRQKWGRAARVALRAGAWAATRFPDAVIAVSGETEAYFARARAVVRIPNGVAEPPPAELAAAGVAGLQPGYVLYLGRIVPEKNVEVLIRAFAAARLAHDLVITGAHGHSADYVGALRRLADALAPGRVRFTGSRYGEAKAALLHHAGVVAFPSRVEGLPIAVLEAMACARTVLASDIAPHRELLAGGCGVLLPCDDVAAWASALSAAVESPGTSGATAQARTRAEYGWEPIADRTLAVYRDVLARRAATRVAP